MSRSYDKEVVSTEKCPEWGNENYRFATRYRLDGVLEDDFCSKSGLSCEYRDLHGCKKANNCPLFNKSKNRVRLHG